MHQQPRQLYVRNLGRGISYQPSTRVISFQLKYTFNFPKSLSRQLPLWPSVKFLAAFRTGAFSWLAQTPISRLTGFVTVFRRSKKRGRDQKVVSAFSPIFHVKKSTQKLTSVPACQRPS